MDKLRKEKQNLRTDLQATKEEVEKLSKLLTCKSQDGASTSPLSSGKSKSVDLVRWNHGTATVNWMALNYGMRYQVEWEICKKKLFKRKLISVLFEILKDKDDYLDATMITRELKPRNPKTWLLSQVVLKRFVFLAFEFITRISSFLFLCFLLIICNIWFVIELIWHASTNIFFRLTAFQEIVPAILW